MFTLTCPGGQRSEPLFDAMAPRYELVSALGSLGMVHLWRRACASPIRLHPGMAACDLMAGSGELWPHLALKGVALTAVDDSPVCCARARRRDRSVRVREEDALAGTLAPGSMDAVFCAFGVKTLTDSQQACLAAEIVRVLRPGGQVCLIEVSAPVQPLLRAAFLGYLRGVVPHLARCVGGEPSCFAQLPEFVDAFAGLESLAAQLAAAGLEVRRDRPCGFGIERVYGRLVA